MFGLFYYGYCNRVVLAAHREKIGWADNLDMKDFLHSNSPYMPKYIRPAVLLRESVERDSGSPGNNRMDLSTPSPHNNPLEISERAHEDPSTSTAARSEPAPLDEYGTNVVALNRARSETPSAEAPNAEPARDMEVDSPSREGTSNLPTQSPVDQPEIASMDIVQEQPLDPGAGISAPSASENPVQPLSSGPDAAVESVPPPSAPIRKRRKSLATAGDEVIELTDGSSSSDSDDDEAINRMMPPPETVHAPAESSDPAPDSAPAASTEPDPDQPSVQVPLVKFDREYWDNVKARKLRKKAEREERERKLAEVEAEREKIRREAEADRETFRLQMEEMKASIANVAGLLTQHVPVASLPPQLLQTVQVVATPAPVDPASLVRPIEDLRVEDNFVSLATECPEVNMGVDVDPEPSTASAPVGPEEVAVRDPRVEDTVPHPRVEDNVSAPSEEAQGRHEEAPSATQPEPSTEPSVDPLQEEEPLDYGTGEEDEGAQAELEGPPSTSSPTDATESAADQQVSPPIPSYPR
jgi:hypothetical protein